LQWAVCTPSFLRQQSSFWEKAGRTALDLCEKGISVLQKHGLEGATAGQLSVAQGSVRFAGKGLCGKEAFLLS